MQQRVALVFTDIKKMSDRCLLMLLFIVGMVWSPVKANTPTAVKKAATGVTVNGKPYTKSVDVWMTYSYAGSTGTNGAVKAGDKIDYRIFIKNTGDEALTIRIVDTLPIHTGFYAASSGGTLNNDVLTWNSVALAPGAQTSVSISVLVDASLSGVDYINNTGYVDIGDGNGLKNTFAPAVDNNINSAIGQDKGWPSTRTPVDNGMNSISWMSVSYTGTGPNNTIQSGDLITYVIHVQNTGTEQLKDVVINDIVPVYTNFYDATDAAPDANNQLSWTIPLIDPGQSVVRSFRVRVATDLTGAKAIVNTATVNNGNGKGFVSTLPSLATDPNQPDPNGEGKESTSIPIVSVVSFEGWKIVISSTNEASVTSGEELLYVIYVRNTGNTTIPTLQVSDPVPALTTFSSAADGGIHLVGSNTVMWAVNNLAAGAIATLHFKVKVDPLPDGIKSIDNTARIQIGGNSDSTSKPTYHCDPSEIGCDKGIVTSIKTAGKAAGMVISNVVTPNSDGKNDHFIVRGIDKYPNSALYIFNRWGGVVYQDKNYQNSWDATGLSEGTYYYRLELNSPTEGIKVFKGWVMIIR